MRDSTIAGNRSAGIAIEGDVVINIGNCMVSNNGTLGISARRGAIARVSNSTVTNNAVAGLSNTSFDPGVIETIGNNLVRGNQKNFEGSITTISGQ